MKHAILTATNVVCFIVRFVFVIIFNILGKISTNLKKAWLEKALPPYYLIATMKNICLFVSFGSTKKNAMVSSFDEKDELYD